MTTNTYSPDSLKEFAGAIFHKLGLSEEDAEIVSDVLITTDLRGISSHGVARIPVYAERIKLGLINPKPNNQVLKENTCTALIDGDNGMGQVASYKAMKLCIKKAQHTGMASVAVRNSNHFGINAYYSMMAAKEGLIGMAFTNTSPLMAPFGGRERLLGSNPLSISVPAGKEPDVVIDMATSVVARGKLEVALKKGIEIPKDWAVDAEGNFTTDPGKALAGALLPFGGHKGYGLALLVDILSGVLTSSKYGPYTGSLFGNMDRSQEIGHFFLAINIDNFRDYSEFTEEMDKMVKEIKNSQKAEGVARIYTPGELEFEKYQELLINGVVINDKVQEELNFLAQKLGIPSLQEISAQSQIASTV